MDHKETTAQEAFQPLFDAADEVKAKIEREERIYALTSKLFDQRDHSTEDQWSQDFEDAEAMIEEEENDI